MGFSAQIVIIESEPLPLFVKFVGYGSALLQRPGNVFDKAVFFAGWK